MNTRSCLKIAERLHVLLQQRIGIGIEPERMLDEPRYRRDVLLVCDAFAGSELAQLASWFRKSAEERAPCGRRAEPAAELDPLDEADRFIATFFHLPQSVSSRCGPGAPALARVPGPPLRLVATG